MACALSQNQYTAAAAHQQQQHISSNSSTTPAVFQVISFVPVVAAYVCVIGAQQEIEPRQHFHVQRNNQTHNAGPHTVYTKHAAVPKAVPSSSYLVCIIGMPMFPLFRLAASPGYQANPILKENLIHCVVSYSYRPYDWEFRNRRTRVKTRTTDEEKIACLPPTATLRSCSYSRSTA